MASIEGPAEGLDSNKSPDGVPGERDALFAHLNEWDHARIRHEWGTDNPKHLDKLTGLQRESFIREYGHPSELEPSKTIADDLRERRALQDRIEKLKQLRIVQGQWNEEIDRILILRAELLNNEQIIIDTSGENPLLHPIHAINRHRALERAVLLRARIAGIEHRLADMRGIITKLGFEPIVENTVKYTERRFE